MADFLFILWLLVACGGLLAIINLSMSKSEWRVGGREGHWDTEARDVGPLWVSRGWHPVGPSLPSKEFTQRIVDELNDIG